MLIAGGEFLVAGAAKLARRLGMSALLIGLTVVAFGTSMPEFFVSIKAMFSGHGDIMFGNVVGSNIANIGLVLAVSAILYPLTVQFSRLRQEFVLLIVASLVLAGAVYFGFFPRVLGGGFVLSLIIYTFFSYRAEHRQKKLRDANSGSDSLPQHSLLLIAVLALAGLALMWLGSNYFIDGAVELARFFGLSELVIGLSVAAVGTSLPELASSISAVRKRETDILVGNILGSNIFNILFVMGSTAVLRPFGLPHNALMRDIPVMLGFAVILVPICFFKREISRGHGLALLVAYCGYIYFLGRV